MYPRYVLLSVVKLAIEEFPFLKENQICRQTTNQNTQIGLLIGLDFYYSIIRDRSKMTSRLRGGGGGGGRGYQNCDSLWHHFEGGWSGSNVTSHILKKIKNMFFQFIQKWCRKDGGCGLYIFNIVHQQIETM